LNISVVICSVNRAAILHETVLSIGQQIYQPAEILIVSPAKEHVLGETLEIPGVRFILSPLGLPVQRNVGLDQVREECDLIAFFDDDIELSKSYLQEITKLFSANESILIASGRLLEDGGRGAIISRQQAHNLCAEYDSVTTDADAVPRYSSSNSAYGCNMVVRYVAAKKVRFDEGLPLYAWLEDRDYSHRITKSLHPPVEFEDAVAVHLGARSGRIGGVRMGFSEIVNPIYLWRKNRTFTLRYILVQYWTRCIAGNILGILSHDVEYDRVGLLKGNLIGLQHVLCGSCNPAHITELPARALSPTRTAGEGEPPNTITSMAS
jgi:glycosyltransferase involved in cell wall biosynthesis